MLPLKAAYALATLLADIHFLLGARDRRAVKENLKAIFPLAPEERINALRRRMFRNFAKYLVDFFRFSKIDKDYLRKKVRIENCHFLDEALQRRKGVITVTAHLGNWELGGVVLSLSGYPFWAVALPHKHKTVDKFFNAQRQSKGIRVIPLGKAARQLLVALRENQVLGLVGDRDFSEKGIEVDFFGRRALVPPGPAVLSLKTGAPIIPGFLFRNKDDTFTLRIEEPLEPKGSAEKEEDVRNAISAYKAVIEGYIRKYADQWYMFRRFWIE